MCRVDTKTDRSGSHVFFPNLLEFLFSGVFCPIFWLYVLLQVVHVLKHVLYQGFPLANTWRTFR